MKFNHLVEINDPLLPLVDILTPHQLWQGFVLRMTQPERFVPYLDRCEIQPLPGGGWRRTLQYGELVICDEVTLQPERQIDVAVAAQNGMPASSLRVTIEAPHADSLFVRFAYEDVQTVEADSAQAFYDKFRHSAYQEADIDTIRLIRQMAQDGRFDSPAR